MLLLIAIASIGAISMANNAYAAVPLFDTYVADDPDDGDTIFSDGDTLTITFSIATNATGGGSISQAEIDANFTDGAGSPDFGTTYSGVWSADSTTLTITVTDVTGGALTIGASTIAGAAGTTIADADGGNLDLISVGGDSATLSGNFGLFVALNGGGGCSGDCTPPTLGMDNNGRRLVNNGFTYNGKPIDVEFYFTAYTLITVDVGVQNKAVFIIYENGGPENIRHFALAFGLAKGQIISNSKAVIEWDKSWDGIEKVNVIDPENTLENVRVVTSIGPCNSGSILNNDCLVVTVYHTFRAPLDFNIVGSYVWDERGNGWQNYYNDGIDVQGESMNPPNQYQGIHKGHLITITETGKNTAIDEDGNTWTFDKSWKMDYMPKGKIDDEISSQGYDRNHVRFNTYKLGHELIAKELLKQICLQCSDESFAEINNIYSYEYPEIIKREDEIELQIDILHEMIKAEQLFSELYEIQHNFLG